MDNYNLTNDQAQQIAQKVLTLLENFGGGIFGSVYLFDAECTRRHVGKQRRALHAERIAAYIYAIKRITGNNNLTYDAIVDATYNKHDARLLFADAGDSADAPKQ